MYFWYSEVDQHFDLPMTVYCDNNLAIVLTQNTSGHSKIKHVDIKTHWIHEAVTFGDIHVEPVSSEENIVDIFTKSLSRPKLENLIKMMGMEFLEF